MFVYTKPHEILVICQFNGSKAHWALEGQSRSTFRACDEIHSTHLGTTVENHGVSSDFNKLNMLK